MIELHMQVGRIKRSSEEVAEIARKRAALHAGMLLVVRVEEYWEDDRPWDVFNSDDIVMLLEPLNGGSIIDSRPGSPTHGRQIGTIVDWIVLYARGVRKTSDSYLAECCDPL